MSAVGRPGYPPVKWRAPSPEARELYVRLKPYAKFSQSRLGQDCMVIIDRFLADRDAGRLQTQQKGT